MVSPYAHDFMKLLSNYDAPSLKHLEHHRITVVNSSPRSCWIMAGPVSMAGPTASFSIPSLAEGSEVISEVEEINKVKQLMEQGDTDFGSQNYVKALSAYTEAMEIDEKNIDIIGARAATYIQLGNFIAAQKDSETLLVINPNYAQGHYLLGVAYDNLGQYQDSMLEFLRAIDLDPDNADLLSTNICSLAAHFCKMPDELMQFIPDMEPYKKLCEVGACLYQASKNELAIKVLTAAEKFETNQKGITMKRLLTLANAHAALKNRDPAITAYQECLSLAAKAHDAQYQTKSLVNIASLFLENGDTHRAIVFYEKLLDLEQDLQLEQTQLPEYWTVDLQCALHLNLSIAYKGIGNMHKAVKHAEMYVSLVKESKNRAQVEAQSYHNVGMLHEILGDYTAALENYKKFLTYAKNKGDKRSIALAYGCLGSVYGNLNNKQLAVTYHEQHIVMARQFQSEDPRLVAVAHEQLGDTLSRLKCHEEAVDSYTNMFQACPRNDLRMQTTALCKLGISFKDQERYQYSLYYFEQAKVIAEDFDLVDVLTLCKYNLACIMQHSTQMYELDHAKMYFEELIPLFEAKVLQHKDEGTFCPDEFYKQLNDCYTGMQTVLSKLGNNEDCLHYAEAQKKKHITSIHSNSIRTLQMANFNTMTATAFNTWNSEKIKRVLSQQNSTVLMYTVVPKHFFVWVLQPAAGITRFYSGRAPKDSTVPGEINKCLLEIKKGQPLRNLPYTCENRALPLRGTELENLKKHYEKLSISASDHKDMSSETSVKSEGSEKKKSPQRRLFDMLVAPIEDVLAKLEPNAHLIVIPDGVMYEMPFSIIQDWSGKMMGSRFRISYMTSIYMLDKAIGNEMNQLKAQDDLEFERNQSRMGGLSRLAQGADLMKSPRDTAVTDKTGFSTMQSIDLESLDPKRTSNPRLAKSGPLPPTPLVRENTFFSTSVPSRASVQPSKMSGKTSSISFRCLSPTGSVTNNVEKVAGAHTFSTLVGQTSTGTDVVTSDIVIPEFKQVSCQDKCVVIGAPALPKRVMLHGKEWEPHCDMKVAQEECFCVSGWMDVKPIVGEAATKDRFLSEAPMATVLHIVTMACLQEGHLVMAPNPNRQEKGVPLEKSYLVSLEDIVSLKLSAKLVVLSGGWSTFDRHYIDDGFKLAGAFIAAGVQCVVTLLWPVPNVVLDKFYFHFYSQLQKGGLVVDAVQHASQAIKQDHRFSEITLWSPYVVIGKDIYVNLGSIRQSMLDQYLDQAEKDFVSKTAKDPLNPEPAVPSVASKEKNLESLMSCLSTLLASHSSQPDVLPSLIEMLDAAMKRLHEKDINRHTVQLPASIAGSEGGLRLLKLLGFHFQAKKALVTDPYTLFPHSNQDKLMIPAYDALRAIQDMVPQPITASAIHQLMPVEQDKISFLVDMMCITKNAPDVQLKTSDLSVKPLWHHTKIKTLLTSIGYHQIGLLLNFNNVDPNRKLLSACLQLFIALSVHKSPILMHKLDVNLLGPHNLADGSSSVADIRLPSLMPLLLPRNQMRMSTPWLSVVEPPEEMGEKMKLARSQSDLTSKFRQRIQRTHTWHEMSLQPQASESLHEIGRSKTMPFKVKVIPGSSLSSKKVPVGKKPVLKLKQVDQRRDYANYVLQQRLDNLTIKHKDDVRKLFLPYIDHT